MGCNFALDALPTVANKSSRICRRAPSSRRDALLVVQSSDLSDCRVTPSQSLLEPPQQVLALRHRRGRVLALNRKLRGNFNRGGEPCKKAPDAIVHTFD